MDEIINKVATSKLEVFDLEDHYPKGTDLKWIFHNVLEGFIKEKEFREHLKNTTGLSTKGQFVAVNCSTDAIVRVGFHISYNSTSPFRY
jgi:hypothetical protein